MPIRQEKMRRSVRITKEAAKMARYDIGQELTKGLDQYLFEPLDNKTLTSIAATTADICVNYKTPYTYDKNVTIAAGENIDYVTYTNQLYTTDCRTGGSGSGVVVDVVNAGSGTYDIATNWAPYAYKIDDSDDYITINVDYGTGNIAVSSPISPEELKRQKHINRLKWNLMPQILVKRFGLGNARKPSEAKAREALHSIVGPQRFRKYLKHGFISVRGRSGKAYQIFPGHKMTKVWRDGVHIEDLCVVMVDSALPPSDSVIMRMLMILDSEEEFRQVANVVTIGQQGDTTHGNFTINNNMMVAVAA